MQSKLNNLLFLISFDRIIAINNILVEDNSYINDRVILNNCTPLEYACNIDKPMIVKKLLEFGADPNMKTYQGNSYLDMVLINNNNFCDELIITLVDGGADTAFEYDYFGILNNHIVYYANAVKNMFFVKTGHVITKNIFLNKDKAIYLLHLSKMESFGILPFDVVFNCIIPRLFM